MMKNRQHTIYLLYNGAHYLVSDVPLRLDVPGYAPLALRRFIEFANFAFNMAEGVSIKHRSKRAPTRTEIQHVIDEFSPQNVTWDDMTTEFFDPDRSWHTRTSVRNRLLCSDPVCYEAAEYLYQVTETFAEMEKQFTREHGNADGTS